ncbi:hypothetical protein T484DRAFT_1912765 [Baffinella frigidus]|nr:hypothetical protein T484DRAFT_1912765 [Cryptophyta sp. CCMP2293]
MWELPKRSEEDRLRGFACVWENKVHVHGKDSPIDVSAHLLFSRGDRNSKHLLKQLNRSNGGAPGAPHAPLTLFARLDISAEPSGNACVKFLQAVSSGVCSGEEIRLLLVCVLLPRPANSGVALTWLSQYLGKKERAGYGIIQLEDGSQVHALAHALVLPPDTEPHREMLPGCSFPALILWERSSQDAV